MFLLWNGAILGYSEIDSMGDGQVDPLKLLQSDETVGTFITAFSLLAVATSFIGFVIGLVDFVGDGLKMPVNTKNALPFAITLFPPAAFALLCKSASFYFFFSILHANLSLLTNRLSLPGYLRQTRMCS